jgi:hypothetical protein
MADWQRRLLGMGLPCLLALLLDTGLTLHGQPAEYWAGDYARTTEGAPFFRKLYVLHPLAGIAGVGAWAGIALSLLVLLPEVPAVVFAIAIVFGHTAGAYTWVGSLSAAWYQIANGMFLASAAVLGVGLHWAVRSSALAGVTESARRLPAAARWGLIVILTAAAGYMYLVPQ